jgi:hypothetical protein
MYNEARIPRHGLDTGLKGEGRQTAYLSAMTSRKPFARLRRADGPVAIADIPSAASAVTLRESNDGSELHHRRPAVWLPVLTLLLALSLLRLLHQVSPPFALDSHVRAKRNPAAMTNAVRHNRKWIRISEVGELPPARRADEWAQSFISETV